MKIINLMIIYCLIACSAIAQSPQKYLEKKEDINKFVAFFDYYSMHYEKYPKLVKKASSELKEILKQNNFQYLYLFDKISKAIVLEDQEKIEQASQIYLNALNSIRISKKKSKHSLILYSRLSMRYASTLADLNKKEESVKYYLLAIEYAEKSNDKECLALVYFDIAFNISYRPEVYDKFKKYIDKANDLFSKIGDEKSLSLVFFSKSMLELSKGNFSEVTKLLNNIQPYVKKINNDELYMGYYLLRLLNNVALENIKKANTYKDSLDLFKHKLSKDDVVSYNTVVAQKYILEKNYEGAINILEGNKNLCLELKNYEEFINSCQGLYSLYLKYDNSKKAIENSNLYFEYKDSIIASGLEFANIDKKIEVSRLKREKQILKELSKTKNLIIILSCIIILGLLIGGYYVFQQNKRLGFLNKKLVEKNKQLVTLNQSKKEMKTTKQTEEIDEKYDLLISKIQQKLEKEKLYLMPDIKLSKLSEDLETNTKYVSEAINFHYKKSFNSIINEFRIKQSLVLLENEQNRQFTIEFIGKQSGFNSKTSFYNAFKQYTGVTPLFYIKNYNNIK